MKTDKIINIVNFIRSEDWRFDPEKLHETFIKQLELCKSTALPYTFLMLYDAIIKPEYADALLNSNDPNMEIGLWLELSKEVVERAGIVWNEEHNWTWHVNPGMLLGYTTDNRKKIIDELMERFKSVFGYYPKSVGSWIIDTFSVNYMYEKYGIKAICICREQYGTDGYTLWGGYYNQGYLPSRKNMFIPAQSKSEQIGVPVFRMLGPDPIYQYDTGLDAGFNMSKIQHTVLTMEPAYGSCGSSRDWVNWYLSSNFGEEAISFAYTQVGQENSFLWERFGEGLKMQLEIISEGVKEGKWQVLKLKDTGENFLKRYSETPATAVTALSDWRNKNNQTVWYNCKNYRINLHNDGGVICIRDLFIFDENYRDRYDLSPAPGDNAVFDALPVIDGYCWGGNGIHSVLYFKNRITGEKAVGKILSVTSEDDSVLKISFELDGEPVVCICRENGLKLIFEKDIFDAVFEYNSLKNTAIEKISDNRVIYNHEAYTYGIELSCPVRPINNGFEICPDNKEFEIKPKEYNR